MKILNLHLPKDIVNIVLDYLYKPDIATLNNEYLEKFVYVERDDRASPHLYYIPGYRSLNDNREAIMAKGCDTNPRRRAIIVSFMTGNYISERYGYSSQI